MNGSNTCEICGAAPSFQWSDTHGVGVCHQCGAPYTIFHYDENKQRVDKAPEFALNDLGKTLALRYWKETSQRVFPGYFDMGFTSRGDRTYSGASRDDIHLFNDWLDKQPETLARKQSEAA